MKLRKLSSSALVAVVAATALAPSAVFAAPGALDSTGKVNVTEGTAGGTDQETVDPEDPTKKIDPVNPGDENTNDSQGSLVLEKTTNLNFGQIKTSANDVTSYAAPMAVTADGGVAAERGAYVQWADVRSGGTYGYTITADLTTQFTYNDGTEDHVLTGSTIAYSNGFFEAEGGNTNVAPSTAATGFTLTETGGAQTVVTADKAASEGKGRYVMAYGDSRQSTQGNSVMLKVPSATASNMVAGQEGTPVEYTAVVTWSITAAP